jgi:hypothetical protein
VSLPRNDDPGQVAVGYYKLEDGLLTMTNPKGVPVRSPNTGKPIQHVMRDGENARSIASRLTLTIRRAVSGETDFNRPLNYSRHGIA